MSKHISIHVDESHIDRMVEPDFADRTAELQEELIPDWMATLHEENRRRMEDMTGYSRVWMRKEVIQYIFTVCLRLHLPREVKYMALAIFDEFMTAHIMGLYTLVKFLVGRTDEQKMSEWEKIESTVSRQLTLRALSAVQIASKVQSYHESLSKRQVKRCLQTLGTTYTEEAVMKSELRVLQTLNFQPVYRNTPVTYVESVLKVLLLKSETKLNPRLLWDYSLLILDCVYLQLDLVYKEVINIVNGADSTNIDESRMRRVQSDYMLLAAGVILTAIVSVHGTEISNKIVSELVAITSVTSEDITDMSSGIIEQIINRTNNAQNGVHN